MRYKGRIRKLWWRVSIKKLVAITTVRILSNDVNMCIKVIRPTENVLIAWKALNLGGKEWQFF